MNNNEYVVKILEKYFKEIYNSLGKTWTEENDSDMKNIVEYLNGNLAEVAEVLEVLDNGKLRVKLNDGKIVIVKKL